MRRRPIGFRVVDLYDKLRGDPFVGRPLRVRLFYPALDNGTAITLHEYLAEWPMSGIDAETWEGLVARERVPHLERRVRGRLDASPDRTRHPLVILAIGRPLDERAAIAESLVLEGCVVGVLPRDADAKDIELAHIELRALADVDEHRIAVVDAYDGNLRALERRLSASFSRPSSRPSRAQSQ